MLLIIAEVALIALLLVGIKAGRYPALFAAIVLTSSVAPVALTSKAASTHVGIVSGQPQIFTYTVVLLVGIIVIVSTGLRTLPPLSLTFALVYTIAATTLSWGDSQNIVAGLQQIASIASAYMIGRYVGGGLPHIRNAGRYICGTVLIVILSQLGVAILQLLGHSPNLGGRDLNTGTYGSRVTGTLVSPGNLSKVVLILVALTLPYIRSEDRKTRNLARASVLLGFILTGMTQSRANAVAIVITLVLWSLLNPDIHSIGPRFRTIIATATISLPFAAALAQRFQQDPNGGARPELLSAGLKQIGSNPIFGIGPNNYVEVVGQTSYDTALGFPVHNAFLLASAELGIPAALLIFWPFVNSLRLALTVRKVDRYSERGKYAAATLATAPGLILIAYTGWGLLSSFVAVLWFFCTGLSTQILKDSPREPDFARVNNRSRPKLRYHDSANASTGKGIPVV